MKISKSSNCLFTLAVMLFLTSLAWSQQQGANPVDQQEYVPNELLIKFFDRTLPAEIQNAAKNVGAKHLKTFPVIGVHHWQLGKGVSVEKALKILSKSPFRDSIEYAEPNYILHADADFPNDPLRNYLWGLHNLGQYGGAIDADIDALEAWEVQQGSSTVVVAVIDHGVDYEHEDLADNIWINPGEDINSNGIVDESDFDGLDNDGNGYVDDIRGWDFYDDDNDPMDNNSHGTHVAGTIGALGNNGIGVTGVSWNVQIMPIRYLGPGGGSTSDAIDSILYAASFEDESRNKIVRITNNSWGGGAYSRTLERTISKSGAIFVASAGNDGSSGSHYPSGYNCDNIISVAATTQGDGLAGWSNYGSTVDLGAPGNEIYSTVLNKEYEFRSGTSMAAPHVAGAAALLMSEYPSWSVDDVKFQILTTVDPLPSLEGKTVTGGRLNVRAALGAPEFPEDLIPPAPVTDLSVTGVTENSITLTWTSTGDDESVGTAYLYDVWYTDYFSGAYYGLKAEGEPIAQPFGSAETFVMTETNNSTGLVPGTTYWLKLRVWDEVGNYSEWSNEVSATTEEGSPTPTPTITQTPTLTETPTITETPTPTFTATPEPTPTRTKKPHRK
ncbi:S8 family serine peptidase [bacterium]|nr:S8 family serine peptidase [bacterium]